MKRKYEVIGIVIDTEKEAEKCSFLSAVLDCKIENFAKITDFFWGGGEWGGGGWAAWPGARDAWGRY